MPEVFRAADEFSYRRPPVFFRWTPPNNALKNGAALCADQGQQARAYAAGDLAHRVVHLLHGAADPCGFVALLADGKAAQTYRLDGYWLDIGRLPDFERANAEGETTLEDTIVRCMVVATSELGSDAHLALMLAAEPGDVLTQLTVQGVPRIVRVATAYLTPLLEPYLSRKEAAALVEVLARLVISYFLAPSSQYDFTNETQARAFVRAHVPFTQGVMQ